MGFIIRALCQILFVHGALLCYQARLEFSDQAFGDIDNTYHELNDDDEGKDANNIDLVTEKGKFADDDKEEVPEIREDSEERRRGGQHRRANGENRRKSKHERKLTKHQHRLSHYNKGYDMPEDPAEGEPADHDRETAQFYLTKDSDIANMSALSALLGPGPVPIQIDEITTQEPKNSPPIIGDVTKLDLDDINNVANISSENHDLVPFVGERKRGSKRKLKSHNSARKSNDAFMKWNDELMPVKKPKKGSRMLHKQNSMLHPKERENTNQRAGHKKRKHKKNHNEALNTRKDIEKYHLNEEEEYANLSIINKSLKSAASKKFDLKNSQGYPLDDEALLHREKLDEGARMVVDKISEEDALKSCLINAERDISEEEESLRDETSEIENKNGKLNFRNNSRKGIKSKIEHGDWVNQVTLLPLPDYSIKKNRTHNKKKFSSLFRSEKIPNDSVAGEKKQNSNKKQKKKKSVDTITKDGDSLVKTSVEVRSGPKSDKETSEDISDIILENDGETENKRDERDTETRASKRHNFKPQKERGIFNRHTDTNDEKGDEIYDVDTKLDEQSYSNLKHNDENTNSNHEISEKAEDYYEYDSKWSGDERTMTEVCIANRTTPATLSTCVTTTETVCSTKPTRKPTKPKSSLRPNDKPEAVVHNGNEFGQRNKTIDPYETFLCGQLADRFVDEVQRKVKLSRKISRELGYSNETEETCDRCIELKPIKVPELAVMRNSLGKCSRSYSPVQNCSMCCGVPKVMTKYLDVLVSFEKENENSFYNKIQDDSTFIFTGDYPESLSKGKKSAKLNDKYVDESPFNKDTFDRQHLREDLNEEKNEDKTAGLKLEDNNSSEKPKDKLREEYDSDEAPPSEEMGKNKETRGEKKRYQRRFSKTKIDKNKEGTFSDIDENVRDIDLTAGFNSRESDPLLKEYSSYKGLGSKPYHRREFGKSFKDAEGARKVNSQDTLNAPVKPDKKPLRNFDRFYGKSNYEYFKQYPFKDSSNKHHSGYRFNYGDSSKIASPKDSREHNGFYKLPDSDRMSNKDDDLNSKNNYYSYSSKKYNQDPKMSLNEKYKGYQSKYDFLYGDNGEYSLYPNLEGRSLEGEAARMAGNYKVGEGGNARMVKRDAETSPVYDDEPDVFFEIPDIEYDLYK